ncbi:hypothetical protein [Salinimicrobium soli]|uniref:hypothetical protein n=1 Tax=Salinimicrobium soli TaxID=1254399 RepID=UPI003AAF7B44
MITKTKDLIHYFKFPSGATVNFTLLSLLNLLVYNYLIEAASFYQRFFLSILLIFLYLAILITINNFIEKKWLSLSRVLEKRTGIGDYKVAMQDEIEKYKNTLIGNFTLSFLILDFIAIISYKNSLIFDSILLGINIILNQAEAAG